MNLSKKNKDYKKESEPERDSDKEYREYQEVVAEDIEKKKQPKLTELTKDFRATLSELPVVDSDVELCVVNKGYELCQEFDRQSEEIKNLKSVMAKDFDEAARPLLTPLRDKILKQRDRIRWLKTHIECTIEDLKAWHCLANDCERHNIERFIKDSEQALKGNKDEQK